MDARKCTLRMIKAPEVMLHGVLIGHKLTDFGVLLRHLH